MTREEAIEMLNNVREYTNDEAIDMAIEALSQPIVAKHFDIQSGYIYCSPQIAENVKVVVRCMDCRWYDNHRDACHNPRYGDGWANYPSPYVDEYYWCKDGERKGGDAE